MENPKIRIESDGHLTEIWIDGKKVERATMADFHAEPCEVHFELEKLKLDKDGMPIVENDDVLKEKIIVIDTMRKGE